MFSVLVTTSCTVFSLKCWEAVCGGEVQHWLLAVGLVQLIWSIAVMLCVVGGNRRQLVRHEVSVWSWSWWCYWWWWSMPVRGVRT